MRNGWGERRHWLARTMAFDLAIVRGLGLRGRDHLVTTTHALPGLTAPLANAADPGTARLALRQ